MPTSPIDRRPVTPLELQERIAADRRALPYLLLRDGDERQLLLELGGGRERLSVGRAGDCDLALEWDPRVSGVHAQLERVGGDWALSDDGLSRNGSFVNGARVAGRRRLADGDTLRFGDSLVIFRAPAQTIQETAPPEGSAVEVTLSPAQRRVLVALCRPYAGGSTHATPATNRQIAGELVLSMEAVKTHMRALFSKLAVEPLPQNRKRARLAELALESGLVSARELERSP